MRLHTGQLWLRISATVLGIGYGAIGGFALHMSRQAPSADLAGRAFWMGITFLIAAVLAIGISWLVKDLSNIWCIPAKRSKLERLGDHDERQKKH